MRLSLLIFALLVLVWEAFGVILPPERVIDWTQVGIPGGVPFRSTIFTNVAAGSPQSTIQGALNSCPSNQVVFLSAGTYSISGPLTIPSGVTLRGAGRSNTIINLSANGGDSGGIVMGYPTFNPWQQNAPNTAVTSGSTKGSTNITVGNVNNILPGGYIVINQMNDTYVTPTNEYLPPANYCSGCGDGWPGSEIRLMGQVLEVLTVNGNTVTFDPPLYINYQPGLSPLVVPFANSIGRPQGQPLVVRAGVESLKVSAVSGAGYGYNFIINQGAYCWIKDIESDFANGDHAILQWCFRCEIRDSYWHDGFSHGPGTHDDTVKLGFKTSGTLTENNVFFRMHNAMMYNYGDSGNVMGYNYSTNEYHSPSLTWQIVDFSFHNAHPMFNLFEGNIGVQWRPDSLHGSSSHNTCLRNWFAGSDFQAPPVDARGPIVWSSGVWEDADAVAFALDYLTRTNNLVGNIAGSSHVVATAGTFDTIAPAGRPNPVEYSFGYDGNLAARDTGQTYASTIFHGNWDFITTTQQFDPTISDHVIPNSYYLSGKPAWFGALTWPPIDPTTPTTANITNIPAGYWFTFGTNPVASVGPALTVNPGLINYGLVFTNTLVTNVYTVGNGGIGTLSGTCSVSSPFFISGSNSYTLASNQTQQISVYFAPTVGAFVTNTVSFTGTGGLSNNVIAQGGSLIVQPSLSFGGDQGTIAYPYVTNAGVVIQTNLISPNLSIPAGGKAIYGFRIINGGAYVVTNLCSPTNTVFNSLWWNIDGIPTNGPFGEDLAWDLPTDGTNSFGMGWRDGGTYQSNGVPLTVWNLTAGLHTLYLVGRSTNFAVQTLTITVQNTNPSPPVANFNASPTNGTGPLTVFFTNLSTLANNFVWTFGDGFQSTVSNATHTYNITNLYTVSLTANGPGGSNSKTNVGYINVTAPVPLPTAAFSAGPNTTGSAPLTVYFTNLSANASSYSWVFGDGNLSTAVNPTNIYMIASTSTVTLIAFSASTNAVAQSNSFIVATNLAVPVANFFGVPTNGASPMQVIFGNTSSGETNTVWQFGDGATATVPYPFGPSHTYTTGTYTVTMTAQGAGGTNLLSLANYIVVTNGVQPAVVLVVPWSFRAFTQ